MKITCWLFGHDFENVGGWRICRRKDCSEVIDDTPEARPSVEPPPGPAQKDWYTPVKKRVSPGLKP